MIRSLLLPSLSAVFLASGFATDCLLAQTDKGQPVEKEANNTPEEMMKAINRDMRALSRFLKSPEGDAPVNLVLNMQKMAMEAKLRIPTRTSTTPEEEQVAFLKGFRRSINELIVRLFALEVALEDGEYEKAGEIAAAINELKSEKHQKYRPARRGRRRRGGDR